MFPIAASHLLAYYQQWISFSDIMHVRYTGILRVVIIINVSNRYSCFNTQIIIYISNKQTIISFSNVLDLENRQLIHLYFYPLEVLSRDSQLAQCLAIVCDAGATLSRVSCLLGFNPLTAKLFNLNFHPLEVVSRWRDPQLQVSENYSDLTEWRSNVCKYCWFMSHFIFNMFKRWYLHVLIKNENPKICGTGG